MKILVCDDDVAIVNAIEIYLKNEGYEVVKAYNGKEAIKLLDEHTVHLIIMDIMMPIMDGLTATNKIRGKHNIPVLMLSAKSEDMDKIMGLNMGADDYLTKPFNPLELIARVRSQLRRYTTLGSLDIKKSVCQSGGLMIDDDTKEVFVDGEKVKLTRIEYNILNLLLTNAGIVFSIDQIYESVWNEPAYQPENTVAVHIRRIREKIEIDPKNPKYLKVVWGVGYKIEKRT
jgi:DNA-binding response OmpR family regulator